MLVNTSPRIALESVTTDILKCFSACAVSLRFTYELPQGSAIRFLGLEISFHVDMHVCWTYAPRSKEDVLPYSYCHSKLTKRGRAMLCFKNALRKSCFHAIQASIDQQASRLKSAGFPDHFTRAVSEKLLKEQQRSRRGEAVNASASRNRGNFVVMPYVHNLSRNINKVAMKHGMRMVFSAPRKLSGLWSRMRRKGPHAARIVSRNLCYSSCLTDA